jgi:protein-tyrosine-phosphatase
MAAALQMLLWQARFKDVWVESAGILDTAAAGEPAPECTQRIGRRLNFESVCRHSRQQLTKELVQQGDLFVCADAEIARRVLELGATKEQVANVVVHNPWPSEWQEDHDTTFEEILGKMYRVLRRYFCTE